MTGGWAVQTQMLREMGLHIYGQILIVPLGQLRPLLDNTKDHWRVRGPRLWNVDPRSSLFAQALQLAILWHDHPPMNVPEPPGRVFAQWLLCVATTHQKKLLCSHNVFRG